MQENTTKLYLPLIAPVPGWTILNKKIPGDAKIFLGVLTGLARSNGYAYGSDEDFSILMGVTTRTIERWMESLEKEGAIERDTKMFLRENKDEDSNKGQNWKKERKIYIGKGVSKNVCDTDTNVSTIDTDKNVSTKKLTKMSVIKNKVSKENKEKDKVETMSSFANQKQRDFSKCLSPEQKTAFDKVMACKPEWGDPPKPKDVCAWMLSKKHAPERIVEALIVYRQDCDDARNRGGIVRSMGACMRKILNDKRVPRNADFEANKDIAKRTAGKEPDYLEMTKEYLKIRLGTLREEISFNLPHCSFISTLAGFMMKIQGEDVYSY